MAANIPTATNFILGGVGMNERGEAVGGMGVDVETKAQEAGSGLIFLRSVYIALK